MEYNVNDQELEKAILETLTKYPGARGCSIASNVQLPFTPTIYKALDVLRK